MAVLVAMAGAGVHDETMIDVMMDVALPIGDHVREQPNSDVYLERQIAKAHELTRDPDTERINTNHALVLVGDKAAVMKFKKPTEFNFITPAAFKQFYANQRICVNKKMITVGEHWLNAPGRRTYSGIDFAPKVELSGCYNLWQGFAVEPREGDCSKFLAHLHDNVTKGDDALFAWVVGWFAQICQDPGNKIGTSLGLRGKEGVGKTKVGEVFGSLLGPHYKIVSDPRYVTGRFNSHLVACLLLHTEEAFWAGDHRAESVIKDLITGRFQQIEYKGKESITVRNHVRLLLTGKNEWQVPATLEERRTAMFDVAETHLQDYAYFAAIDDEMDHGGREALLHYLLNFDLSKVNLRVIPKTDALREQKVLSLDPFDEWWVDLIEGGVLPLLNDKLQVPSKNLYERARANSPGLRNISDKKIIDRLRKRGCFTVKYNHHLRTTANKQARGIQFPALIKCRREWDEALGQPWPDETQMPEKRWELPEDWQREDDVI